MGGRGVIGLSGGRVGDRSRWRFRWGGVCSSDENVGDANGGDENVNLRAALNG